MPPIPEDRLEDLKEALRRRGYLDRVILRHAATPLGRLQGYLKAVLLAAIALDVAFVVMLAFLGSPPLASRRDALVLALYLAPFCLCLGLAVELAAGILTRLLGRMVPAGGGDSARLAGGVGGTIALGFALYLSLWWRGRGEAAPGDWTRAGFVLFILLVSLFLGRLASLTSTLALLRAGRIGGLARAGGRFPMILVTLLLVVIAAALWRWRGAPSPPEATPSFASVPAAGRTLWIGIDGLGSSLLQAMAQEDHVPQLAARAQSGCTVRLKRSPAEPPAIWVTAATGFAPPRHGIGGVESAVVPGLGTPLASTGWSAALLQAARALNPFVPPIREVPVSGVHRKDKTVWEILAQKGVPSYIVNWWTTWPADEGPGVRITERALFRLESGGPQDREVFPPERLPDLEKAYARRFREDPGAPRSSTPAGAPAMDRFHLDLAAEGWSEHWPLVAVYLNGLDVLAAAPAGRQPGRLGELLQDRVVIDHLESLDRDVGSLAAGAAPNDFVILEGDPGRNDPAGGSEGFLILSGPGVAPGKEVSGSLLDVAPTLLSLQGFPRSLEMRGRVLRECLEPGQRFVGEAAGPVAGFGPRRPPSGGGSEFDPQVLEKLRSLGYIR